MNMENVDMTPQYWYSIELGKSFLAFRHHLLDDSSRNTAFLSEHFVSLNSEKPSPNSYDWVRNTSFPRLKLGKRFRIHAL
jgi:hypothetical protein